jgi:hypothetical protein
MLNGLEKRLARLEQRIEALTEEPKVCSCRVETRFHGADCLGAVLKGMSRVCPDMDFENWVFSSGRPGGVRLMLKTISFVRALPILGGPSC